MSHTRLWAAAVALILAAAALGAIAHHARSLETRHVHAIAPQMFAQKMRGSALQRAAFQAPDLLPLYGSSDLNVANRDHPSALFRDYPTGFTVFPVGNPGSTSLLWLQALAAAGDLRGKRLAVSVPLRAFSGAQRDGHAYAANFSPLHAGELAFNPRLSFAVKQAAARRMLAVPETLDGDPLLRFALERLAGGSVCDRLLYGAAVPLGMLRNAILRLQDHWETLAFLRSQVGIAPISQRPGAIDWATERERADAETRRQATNNPFRFANAFWASHATEIAAQKGSRDPDSTRREVEQAAEWEDFELLLRGLRELGAEPLLLSIPLNDAYSEHLGVPAEVRSDAVARLHRIAAAHGLTVVDFEGDGSAEYFTVDPSAHLSGAGWVRVDRALDEFVHRGSNAQ